MHIKNIKAKVSWICFFVSASVYLLFLFLIAISSDQGQYFSIKGIVQLGFVMFVLPALILISTIGGVMGIFAACKTPHWRGLTAMLLNVIIITSSVWYIWAYYSGVLYRMQTGESKIQYALDRSDLKMLKKELDRGADVNTRCRSDETPLIRAIWNKNREMFDIVMAHHPDVNVYCNGFGYQETALHYIAGKRFDNSGYTAGSWEPLEIAKILLDHGANPNLKVISSYTDQSYVDITALSLAYENEKSDLVDLLLSYKADINVKTHDYEKTILHVAVERGDIQMVKRLIGLGAKLDVQVNKKPYDVETPLQIAVRLDNIEIAKLLIDSGADMSLRSDKGPGSNALLHTAVIRSNVKMIELLIDYGADVNLRRSADGSTPLHFAVIDGKGRTDIVQILLENGANPNVSAADFFNYTNQPPKQVSPLSLARKRHYSELEALLITYGAKE